MVWLRDLKAWVEGLAHRRGAGYFLFAVAFAESSFFPIPPDVLLIALGVLAPKRAFWNAAICSAGSVLGGVFGYYIGLEFYDVIGRRIIEMYGVQAQYLRVQQLYEQNAFSAIAIAGFTPIPYKVFTIAAGAFHIPIWTLVLASAGSRPARFFLVSALFYWHGPKIKGIIDKYFEILTVLFVVLLILGFLVIRWLL
ncbi:MAG: DedA family protein [Acidobacteria bacterium]|nr:DedA family protein [Acidobacteriota bacterium]